MSDDALVFGERPAGLMGCSGRRGGVPDWTVVALPDDRDAIAAVADLLHRTWPACYPVETARDRLRGLAGRALMPGAVVARLPDGTVAGAVMLIPGTTPFDQPAAVLIALVVRAAHRRWGIGASLCQAAAPYAAREGVPLGAYTIDQDRFFRRLGWRATRAVITSAPGSQPVWYFEKPAACDGAGVCGQSIPRGL